MSATDINPDFSLSHYTDIIHAFQDRGYHVCNFETAEPDQKHIVLRHDVDMSPAYALTMAKHEASIDVQSTYFFLLRDPLYNLFTAQNTEILREITALGHDIGLHFDASIYGNNIHDLDKNAALECEWLEDLCDQKVNVISFHRPIKELYNYEPLIAGRIHAYQPKFFTDMEYCSDSKGLWRFGHPLEREFKGAIQLLTHPIWWVWDDPKSPQQTLETYINDLGSELKNTLFDTYKV